MSKSITTFLIFSLLLLGACQNEKYQKESIEFSDFLKTNFNQSVPKEQSFFLLFPSNICKNCFALDAHNFNPIFLKKMYIVSGVDSTNFHHFENIYLDKNDKIIRLSFVHYQCQIVIVDKGKIVNIIPLNDYTKQLDSLQKVFAK